MADGTAYCPTCGAAQPRAAAPVPQGPPAAAAAGSYPAVFAAGYANLERLAHPGLDDPADLHALHRPARLVAEHGHADDLVRVHARQIAGPVLDLERLGHLEAGLEADRDVVRDVGAADRQDRGVERRAVDEQGQVDRAGADVGDRDAEIALRRREDGLGRGEPAGDQLVDLDVGRGDALGEVLDRGRRGGDDVGLDLEADRAHAERVHHALLAVDGVAAGHDVEDLAGGRDRDGPGDLDGAVDVLLGHLAARAATATGPAS